MIAAVFFDMYGTLAGFKPSRFEVQSQVCTQFGIEVTPEGIRKGYASADAYMAVENSTAPLRLRSSDEKDLFFTGYERLVLRGSGIEISPERASEIWRRIRQVPYDLAPFPDVMSTLQELRSRGIRLAMISNMNRSGPDLAGSLGLSDKLDFTITSLDIGAEKPHPDVFLEALRRAEVKSEEAVHVGDQPVTDIHGAEGVGIQPVLLDRDDNYNGFNRCPRIRGLSELPKLLDPGSF